LLGGCGGSSNAAPATTGDATPAATGTTTPADSASPDGDTVTGVYLLGGSSARECIVGNADWTAQIEQLGGPPVHARDLGTSNQTFARDGGLVAAMPKGPTLVLIGITVGRFTSEPATMLTTAPASDKAAVRSKAEVEHRYKVGGVRSAADKRGLAEAWAAERYPLFKKHLAANVDELRDLVAFSRERGFTPVLLELPLDLEAAGDALRPARAKYTAACHDLAESEGVPYVSFVDEVAIPSAHFYDLFHLVGPGRDVWQKRLSQEIVDILAQQQTGGQQ
jgi:hypothetical protein